MDLQEVYTAKDFFHHIGFPDNELASIVSFSREHGVAIELMGQFDIAYKEKKGRMYSRI